MHADNLCRDRPDAPHRPTPARRNPRRVFHFARAASRFPARGRQPASRKAAERWSVRITANARGKAETPARERNEDEASLTTHTLYLPDEPRHTVHEVALERAPPETVIEAVRELARAN